MNEAGEVAPGRVFVDFGCGKGRALLLAAEYPFRRIVGVEFFPQLVEIARKNLFSYRNPRQVCPDLEVVLGDAALFPIPDAPLVLYFNDPFDGHVLERVVLNIRRSLDHHPRPITVIHRHSTATPELDSLWSRVTLLRKGKSLDTYSIYHS